MKTPERSPRNESQERELWAPKGLAYLANIEYKKSGSLTKKQAAANVIRELLGWKDVPPPPFNSPLTSRYEVLLAKIAEDMDLANVQLQMGHERFDEAKCRTYLQERLADNENAAA